MKILKTEKKSIIILLISLLFLVLSFLNWQSFIKINKIFYVFYYFNPGYIVVALCGYKIFKYAYLSIKEFKLTASILISMAMIACIILEIIQLTTKKHVTTGHKHSFIFAAAEIAFLMSLGELIEKLTINKCRSGIEKLSNLMPDTANLIINDSISEVKTSTIVSGDLVVVKAGEYISTDGIIIEGKSSVDESNINGEPIPRDVVVNDLVYAGTLNKTGIIKIEVSANKNDTMIAKMARLVEEAEDTKTPIARVADRFAGYIVPFVLITAVIVFLISLLGFKINYMDALIRAVTVLVVFCPCALVIATPTAISAAIGNMARKGVLVRKGAALEALVRVNSFCFDKTGTITEGNIVADKYVNKSTFSNSEFGNIIASLEQYSEHPLAKGVVSKFKLDEELKVSDVVIDQGVGIRGCVNGIDVKITNGREERKDCTKEIIDFLKTTNKDGKTISLIYFDNKIVGAVSFIDKIRENSKELISSLKEKKYKVYMLTGDSKKGALNIATKIGMDNVKSELLPSDKVKEIKTLEEKGENVCMVGDGVNDAPALATANCSMALGRMSNDIAMESSDIVILNNDIGKISSVLDMAKKLVKKIKVNIVFAMSINIIAIIFATLGYLSPMLGALLHNLNSIIVALSSMMLLFYKGKKNFTKTVK